MQTDTPRGTTIDLDGGQLTIFEAMPGERVRLVSGAAWLTQEGEPGDSVLQPGDELPLHSGRVLVGALGRARLRRFGAAQTSGTWRRVRQALRDSLTRLQFGPTQPERLA